MKIAVIDGMGGGIGAQIVSRLRQVVANSHQLGSYSHQLIALGTNAMATTVMIKAGADIGATGENPINITAPQMDIIVGPIGIIIPNSLMGEITPKIAETVASSKAIKVLIPVQQPHVEIIGFEPKPLSAVLDEVAARVSELVHDMPN